MQLDLNDYEPKEIMKIIREWTELTQKEFGKSINKSGRTIEGYENGSRNYNLRTVKQIAKQHQLQIIIKKK